MSQFLTHTEVSPQRDSRWQAEVHRGWRIGSVANGGYVLALVGRALSEALNQPDPLSINAFYLAPVALGEVEVAVELLSETRSTHFASADLRQEGELKLRATAAYTDLDKLMGPDWTNVTPPDVPSFENAAPLAMSHLEIHQSIDLRMVQGAEVFTQGKTNGTGEFIAWLAHKDGAAPGPIDLMMFADIMPPPIFTIYGAYGWVPTVELTVQVRRKPAAGPLLARHTTHQVTRGVAETDTEIWDVNGDLVAMARQTYKVRMPKAD
jgi:acyl-coenzyme A thioesterase PaaI-like protein